MFLVLFVLSVYVRRTFRVPLISGSSRVFVSRSRCPAGRSAPCRGRCGASGPPGARWWGSRGLSGGGGAQQGGEERAEQKCQAQCVRAGTVTLFAPFAARLLAQNPLEVRRTAAALVLNARPPVLAQEELFVTHVRCGEKVMYRLGYVQANTPCFRLDWNNSVINIVKYYYNLKELFSFNLF